MDVVVCVKTNPDLQMVRIKDRHPVLDAVPYKVGDLEKNALEAGCRLRDAAGEGKVTVLTVAEGNKKIKETIKEALAMGGDEAYVIADPALESTDQAAIAGALAGALRKMESWDLLLFGEGSSDNYSGQIGPRVAQILGLPQIGYARAMEKDGDGLRVERSMEEYVETLSTPLPAAVTVVSEINEPRIPSLMNIMKAGKKPVTEWTVEDLGLEAEFCAAQKTVLSNLAEEQDRKRIMLEGDAPDQAQKLVDSLIKEGVLGR